MIQAGAANYPAFPIPTDPSTAPNAMGNLRTQMNSPIIDIGNNLAVSILKDLDCLDRINQSVDFGACENPFVNGPNKMLTSVYAPFSGNYEGANEIHVEDGIILSPTDTVVLTAPFIVLNPATLCELGPVLTVENVVCSQLVILFTFGIWSPNQSNLTFNSIMVHAQ